MGYKVFTIKPEIDWKCAWEDEPLSVEPIQVIFTWSKPKLENNKRNQTVTNCLLRQGLVPIGIGFTVENPNDEPDQAEGFHWAFKRAVNSMLHRIEFKSGRTFGDIFRKDVDKSFRRALWEARNGND